MNSLKIIAEVAQGYEGKPELAEMLVKGAAAAGADAVKFQLIYADELATPDYKHFQLFQSLEMQDAVWLKIASLAQEKNISLFLDVYGAKSLKLAEHMQVSGVKIHSTDMQNLDLLKSISKSKIPLIFLSISGCLREEVHQAIEIMGEKNIVLLHGFQSYPTPIEANQIKRLSTLMTQFGNRKNIGYGFADHVPVEDELRFTLAAVAIGFGVSYLEKHLTLSKVMKLEDHESALSPDEFLRFVRFMRQCHQAVGETDPLKGEFTTNTSELDYRRMTHKHVVTARKLESGTLLTPELLTLKRTAAANPLYDIKSIYGKRLTKSLEQGVAVTIEVLET